MEHPRYGISNTYQGNVVDSLWVGSEWHRYHGWKESRHKGWALRPAYRDPRASKRKSKSKTGLGGLGPPGRNLRVYKPKGRMLDNWDEPQKKFQGKIPVAAGKISVAE